MAYFTHYYTVYFRPLDTQTAVEQPTGGWRNEYSAELRRRLRRKLQLEDDEETVEAALEAAGVPIPAPVLLAPVDDVVRLRGLVKACAANTDDHTKRAQRAMDYAARAKSALAYELALREIAKEIEDEEAVIAILLLH